MLVLLLISASAGQSPRFVDATAEAGLLYQHWQPPDLMGATCREWLHMAGGAAAGDYDGDGWVDLFVTRVDAPNLLFRNDKGRFVDVGAAAGVDAVAISAGGAWLDLENDGDLDLFVTVMEGLDLLYVNDGSGRFTEDGGGRGVAGGVSETTTSAFVGDYDRDGDLDLYVLEWPFGLPAHNRLFRNDGEGRFDDVTLSSGAGAADVYGFAGGFVDLDGDGWLDIAVAGDFGTSRVWRNTGSGSFEDMTALSVIGSDENGMGSAFGDVDQDGDLDWFVTSIFDPNDTCARTGCNWGASGNRLYRNDGDWRFTDITDSAGVRDGGWGWGATFFDADHDGHLDLAMTNGIDLPCIADDAPFVDDPMRLWRGDGSGFADVTAEAGITATASGKGLLSFDYDRDGDLDLFVAHNRGSGLLLRNDGAEQPWLQVRLRGRDTNRHGLGAVVRLHVTPEGPVQMRPIHGNTNYMAQEPAVAHFGVGSAVQRVAEIEVTWPLSGVVSSLRDVEVNQVVTIAEADPEPPEDRPPTMAACGTGSAVAVALGLATCVVWRRRPGIPA